MIPSSLIPDLYLLLALCLAVFLCGLLVKMSLVMEAAARWIEHDLKMRRGGKS
jgi:hypothetical protein